MNHHGGRRAYSPSTEQSFSEQDDPRVQNIRQKLRSNRGHYERALADIITTSFISSLVSLQVLTQTEGNRIKAKTSAQSKSASLLDMILRKNGTAVNIFVDSLRDPCVHVYETLNARDYELESSLGVSSSYLSTEELIQQTSQRAASKLQVYIANALCCIPQFLIHITSIIDSGFELSLLTFSDSLTLMHELIKHDRQDLLKCIQYVGKWNSLVNLRIGQDNRTHSGQTPLEYSVAINRPKCRDRITSINNVELTLDAIAIYVRAGDVRNFKEEMRKSPSKIRYKSNDTLTLLDYACQSGSAQMVQEVIREEKAVRFTRGDGVKAAGLCVELGHFQLLTHLKDYMGGLLDFNQVLLDNKHLIEKAAFYGDFDMYQELLRLGARPPKSILSIAASQNCVSFIRSVLGLDPSMIRVLDYQDRRRKIGLHFAAEKGYEPMVKLLLELGSDPLKTDMRGFTALHSASMSGNVELARMIVAKAEESNNKQALLKAKDQYTGFERIFLVRGHDNARPAWHYVEADRAYIDIFRKKTRGGAVDVADYGRVVTSGWGVNPPQDQVRQVEEGYDVTRVGPTTPKDLQALHLSIIKGHTEFVLFIIDNMDDVNEPDCFGLTPLHLAAMRGNREIIQALLAKAAVVNSKDRRGRTPEDIAKFNEHPHVLDLLKSQEVAPVESSDPDLAALRRNLERMLGDLSDENIARLRQEEGASSAKRFIRDQLREANADINDYLYEIGAGPVSSDSLG